MKALVIMPTYNSGPRLLDTVRQALEFCRPVWVVVDGSTDGSDADLINALGTSESLRVIHLPENGGKGAAVFHAACEAHEEGYTHACVIDADGQHCCRDIPLMLEALQPGSFVLGVPIFGPEAPPERVKGRRVGNTFAQIETLFAGPADSLFGFRVYPLADLIAVMKGSRWARRYDFDTEVAVRLVWRGLRPINVPTPVRYLTKEEGGISHFNYLRDNLLLTGMHTRLLLGMLPRLPRLIVQRRRWRSALGKTGTAAQRPATSHR